MTKLFYILFNYYLYIYIIIIIYFIFLQDIEIKRKNVLYNLYYAKHMKKCINYT